MSVWPEVAIASVSKHVTVGFVGSQAPHFVDAGIPLLRGQNIRPYVLDLTNLKYISPETHAKWKKSSLRAGDVAIVRVGYPGTAAVIPHGLGDLNAASLVIVRPDPGQLDSDFLAYVLNSPWGKAAVSARFVGSAQQVLNTGAVADLKIALPALPVQQAIARVLRAIDDLIENNRRRLEVLEEVARTIYREWFVKFRYPGHESVPHIDSALGPIPEGWTLGTVDGLVRVVKDSVDPSTLDPATPAVGLEHIPRQQITLDAWGQAGDQGSRKAVFQRGDILFGKIRPYFHKVSVAPIDGICSTDAIVIRPHDAHWGQIVAVVSSADFVAHATSTSNGTKMPRADWKVIGQWPVAVPPTSVAEAFTLMVREQLALAEKLMHENRSLTSLRDLLLPKLMTGQVDVSALDLDALIEGRVA